MGPNIRLADLGRQNRPRRVLMVSPKFFDVEYVINPHMRDHVGTGDRELAARQWLGIAGAYQDLGLQVDHMDGAEGLPDMVFCANQTFPGLDRSGNRVVVLSQMASEFRRLEVGYFDSYFRSIGYESVRIEPSLRFEGCGDALWHADRRLIWLGHGFRSDTGVARLLEETFGVPVIPLELFDEDYYHLDTCLSVLTARTALWVPKAFSEEAAETLRSVIPELIEVPADEALHLFACNAHSPDGRSVLIQKGCAKTNELLRAARFRPIEVETGEFLKAGGSVFCMKQMYW